MSESLHTVITAEVLFDISQETEKMTAAETTELQDQINLVEAVLALNQPMAVRSKPTISPSKTPGTRR